MSELPLNKPFLVGNELKYVADAASQGHFSGPGLYTKKCEELLEQKLDGSRILLTASCGTALELAAAACDLSEGDEVILPAFTHPATANAFLKRGAKPVFVDIRQDTCNLDERLIEPAITPRTRAIIPVHYAGVACAMKEMTALSLEHNITVIEDAAHAVGATYQRRALGNFGQFGAFSFHGTKNIACGEGGALIVGSPEQDQRVEMIRDSGMDRLRYMRGETTEYGWKEVGSSSLISEILAAFLLGQLEQLEQITLWRRNAFYKYYSSLQALEAAGVITLPVVPAGCEPNGHIFYVKLLDKSSRDKLIEHLGHRGIGAAFHYLPLHTSDRGRSYGYKQGQLPVTEQISQTLVRLPLYFGIIDDQINRIVEEIFSFFGNNSFS